MAHVLILWRSWPALPVVPLPHLGPIRAHQSRLSILHLRTRRRRSHPHPRCATTFSFIPPSLSSSHQSAYLTNPTEISFRAYLTEQSFRQHLSHLDDPTDDAAPELDCALSRARSPTSDHSNTIDRAALPFHFANRASVSLRTPKHIFHSFGICTIATTQGAAVPAGTRRATSAHSHPSHHSDLDGFVSSDSWFIGAFGRWWRGGLVESWCYDAMIRSKDAQGWSSGILGFKALDKLHDYNGKLPTTCHLSLPLITMTSPPICQACSLSSPIITWIAT